jgi:hypothetical protein
VAYRNLIDNASTTVTANTIGAQLDMQYRTTLGRAALGVPVRLRVWAVNTNAGEAQSVRLLNSAGSTLIEVSITDTGSARWYVQDGYIPATDAKYDLHFGGATVMPTVYSISLEEFCDDQPNAGTTAPSLDAVTLAATGTFVAGANNGALSVTLDATTLSATGTNTINGVFGSFTAAMTVSATGTFTPGITWTVDSTSNKGVPANSTEWGDVLTQVGVTGTVAHLYLMQEASGNLTDSVGSVTLTAASSPDYNQTVSGWTRKFLGEKDAGFSVAAFSSTSASLPDLSTTSVLMLVYGKIVSTPDAEKDAFVIGGSSSARYVTINTTPAWKLNQGGGGASATGGTGDNDVHPIIIQVDRTNSVIRFITDEEILTPTWSNPSVANKLLGFGSVASAAAAQFMAGYAVVLTGNIATTSRANLKVLLETLGWTVGWTP